MKRNQPEQGPKRALKRRRSDPDVRRGAQQDDDRLQGRSPIRPRQLVKTRRRSVQQPRPPRRPSAAGDNQGFLNDVYRRYYRNSRRVEQGDLNNSVYRFSGYGSSEYTSKPLKEGDVLQLAQTVAPLCEVFPQGKGTMSEALAKGDYFYFDSKIRQKTSSKGAYGGKIHERRLVVNLKSQQAALSLAGKLVRLFDLTDSRAVAPYFRQFKVKLSTKAGGTEGPVKYDKLVLYYGTDERDVDGDRVGTEIAEFLDDTVPDADRDDRFGAFYSKVVKGVAWAEEPDHIDVPKPRSFTDSRTSAVVKVIQDNRYVSSPADFRFKVYDEFERSNIAWPDPHRNIEPPDPPTT
ncbi:T3SS effector HopA1 family protein [Nonomuraea zeae]|uniref:Uncharacterized protein n=1 Tax=Nonomuraea zeae TaxID=1642303 RepID=A0A5S4H0Z5_9ACTN|nr:T3SS effector HopA1 family protein [Nonomuraea zeae]TMR38895.1 hypothetical protein ETD85_03540 [Nonomuraea zeae]